LSDDAKVTTVGFSVIFIHIGVFEKKTLAFFCRK